MRMASIRGDHAVLRFGHALQASAGAAGCTLSVGETRSRPWSSATYAGEQVTLAASVAPADAAKLWLDGLAEAELPMRGHVAMPPAVETVSEAGEAFAVRLTALILLDS